MGFCERLILFLVNSLSIRPVVRGPKHTRMLAFVLLSQLMEGFGLTFLGVNFSHRGARVSPCSHSLASIPQSGCWERRNKAGVSSPFPWTIGRPGRGCAHLSVSDSCRVACRRRSGLLGLAIKMSLPHQSSNLASTYLSILNSHNSRPRAVCSTALCIFPSRCLCFCQTFHLECHSLAFPAWRSLTILPSFL